LKAEAEAEAEKAALVAERELKEVGKEGVNVAGMYSTGRSGLPMQPKLQLTFDSEFAALHSKVGHDIGSWANQV